jgi:hypothetical protein
MGGKDWGRYDKQVENETKQLSRDKSRRYYNKHREKVIERVSGTYQDKRVELFKELGGKCNFCGQDRVDLINFHHRVPMKVKGSKIYHYHKNKDILINLCIPCHVTWHLVMDWLNIDDIFKEDGLYKMDEEESL